MGFLKFLDSVIELCSFFAECQIYFHFIIILNENFNDCRCEFDNVALLNQPKSKISQESLLVITYSTLNCDKKIFYIMKDVHDYALIETNSKFRQDF